MSNKYTPDVAELLPVRQYRCEHCSDQVFGNQSHYQLHLRRRHKINKPSIQSEISSYHCPVENCVYHAEREGSRGFANLRFLRQHYQKIHLPKEYRCNECNETFLLERHLEKHKCCSVYACSVCGLTYTSKASLQTHMRRKNHNNNESLPATTKVPLPTLQAWKRTQQNSKETNVDSSGTVPAVEPPLVYYCLQLPAATEISSNVNQDNELPIPSFTAEEVERLLRDMETQTDDVDLDTLDMVPLLRDIQTQTLDNRQHQGTMTELELEENASDFVAYQQQEQQEMFALQTSAHNMHTQTCDELFEELGLSHIQTQTHCPDGLYNTQHTQTCDEMLDEFLENFQSTCTQTRWLDWQETEDASH